MPPRVTFAAGLLGAAAVAMAGCGVQEMDDQPKHEVFEPVEAPWPQGPQPPVEGTIARGTPLEPIPDAVPHPVDRALLERGRERYGIHCAPCHSPVGDGQGMIVQRGYPAPPSYHTPRLRAVSDRHIYQVISHGYGIMFAYAARIAPRDRWAIVAYVRALQLSQHAPAEWLPPRSVESRSP